MLVEVQSNTGNIKYNDSDGISQTNTGHRMLGQVAGACTMPGEGAGEGGGDDVVCVCVVDDVTILFSFGM